VSEEDEWWLTHGVKAGDELNEILSESNADARTYREAEKVAHDSLLLMAPLLRVDPSFGDHPESREKLLANLARVSAIARAIYEGQRLPLIEIDGARFVMTCLEPVGDAAVHVVRGCRYALAAVGIAERSVVFNELWSHPAPEAWCLAELAYEELVQLGEIDNESESNFWVRPDDAVVSLAAAHRISDAIRDAGGGETMSSN
jgi:hypothetical protein